MKRIILLPLACMAATLLAQHHASRSPLTAEQVKQQSLTRMINDEIQHRQQQASPEQYQQIAQQVSRQYSQLMNDPSQLDPRHALPTMAAQAIEQKLDSVIEFNHKYFFQYDTDRQLMLNATRYELTDGQWEFYVSYNFVYDTQNRVIERDEIYSSSNSHYEITYNSRGMQSHYKQVYYEYDDQHNVVSASGYNRIYNDQGYMEREANLAFNPAVGLYERFAIEYEYFDVPQGEYYSDYIRKTSSYRCPEGSFTLEAYGREEWQEDRLRSKEERYINGRWYTTYLSTIDDFGLTRTQEWYAIENGTARLSEKDTETNCGNPDIYYIPSRPIRCWISQGYDAYGNVTYGYKVDHLYDWGNNEFEVDYYHWNSSIKDWEIEDVEYSHWNEEPYEYEGKTRIFCDCPINSSTTQIYHNGQWETIGFCGPIEAEPLVPYGNSGYKFGKYRTLHFLNYSINPNNGNYEYYEETFYKFENGRQVSADTYDMPNRTHQAYRYEYDYTPVGDPAETRYFNTETGSLELNYRDVYVYDPSISTNQVLHSGNTNYNMSFGNYYYYYNSYDLSSYHAKPLSVKRYDAAGNFMEDLTLYYYSSLHGDSDEGLPEITPDDPYGDLNPFLNLMGQPLASPLPGRPVIDVRHRQVIVR